MSSPIDRPSDTDGISRYAPKWARDVDNLLQQHLARPHVRSASGINTASLVPADGSEYDYVSSLAPIVMPEPPVPEPWFRGGGGLAVVLPFIFAVFLAALIALVIVVEWPNIWERPRRSSRPQIRSGRASTANRHEQRLRRRPRRASRDPPASRIRTAPSGAPTLGPPRSIPPPRRPLVHRRSRSRPLQRPRWLIRHPRHRRLQIRRLPRLRRRRTTWRRARRQFPSRS